MALEKFELSEAVFTLKRTAFSVPFQESVFASLWVFTLHERSSTVFADSPRASSQYMYNGPQRSEWER